MDERLVSRHGWTAFREPSGDPGAGATALMLAAVMQRRLATGATDRDEQAVELGRFLLELVEPSGAVLTGYDLEAGAATSGERSLYATGQVLWDLELLDRAFPGEGWRAPARLVSAYLATTRDEAEGVDFAPWGDQWASYALADATWTLSVDEVRYARSLAQRFGLYVRTEATRQSNAVARYTWGGTASGAGLGVEVEGLGSLLEVARSDPRLAELRTPIAERMQCGAGILAARQVVSDDPLANGAWFDEGVTRMDDQQHALSGLIAALGRVRRG
jgi:hypothetical protein